MARSSLKAPYAHSLIRLGDWLEKSAFWAADMWQIVKKAFSGFNNARSLLQYTHKQL